MPRYRLYGGRHEQNGRTYERGEVIETDLDLPSLFPNKFELAHPDIPPEQEKPPSLQEEPVPVVEVPKAADVAIHQEEQKDAIEPQDEPPTLHVVRRRDVTRFYPLARDNDFVVYKAEGKYYVYDKDDVSTPLNEEGVKKNEVDQVIRKALDR